MTDRLIITLTLHPRFGYLLQPFFASFDAGTGVYSITETVRRYENLSMPLFVRNSQWKM